MCYYFGNNTFTLLGEIMAVIYPYFLRTILSVHENIHRQIPYPFFDPACVRYEALRAVLVDGCDIHTVLDTYGLSDYDYRKCVSAFQALGVAGLIGLDAHQLIEPFPLEAERMVYVLKQSRPCIPATKMVLLLKGFHHDIPIAAMRHLYASYGWALGTQGYPHVDFESLNLKTMQLSQLQSQRAARETFWDSNDRLQALLEVFRTLDQRGITRRYPGSRVSLALHKNDFLSLGLVGLVERAPRPFRNSKLGFQEEGWIVLSKIQHPENTPSHYVNLLRSKKIHVDVSCLSKLWARWNVDSFQTQFKGTLDRLLESESETPGEASGERLPAVLPLRLDQGFLSFLTPLDRESFPLANPGLFLFLPYLNRLRIYEKAASLMELDPSKGYSWFSLLLLNLGRILGGICSASKACRTHELSLPLLAGLVGMPCADSLLNGLAGISENQLLQLRRHLSQTALDQHLIEGKRIAFDFHMRDFTNEDVNLKNISKGPSPKRKICFPGFRPHLAWDVDTGTPISLEFRPGKARATTTLRRFIRELFPPSLGEQHIEHVYLDSEYTAEYVWQFIVDPEEGLGADLTMCVKQNKKVKNFISTFLQTGPTWVFYDEDHTYTEQTFPIPIQSTGSILQCVLKRKESTGNMRCFGSTLKGLDARGILDEYKHRWIIENGIKDLIGNYYFDNIPGIDPHRIDLHYFIVTLARILYELFCRDYEDALNSDGSKKTIGTLRPEFMVGTNASLSRSGNELILLWNDPYPLKKHQVLESLFAKLNKEAQYGFPFLGNLRFRFQIVPPKPDTLCNQFERKSVEF